MNNCDNLSKENIQAVEEYLHNHFNEVNDVRDDSFLAQWQNILADVPVLGIDKAINVYLASKCPIDFVNPEDISLTIYNSFAGPIPVFSVKNVSDFENIVTNVVHKGQRPDNIESTGASFVCGKTIRFIILSQKPYSNVLAEELGLEDDDWLNKSMIIRREHECTHYYTKWKYGTAMNHLHDELIADFNGVYSAFGEYKAEYFLRFMGIIGSSGSRLQVYVKGMPQAAVEQIKQVAIACANYLEEWSKTPEFLALSVTERIDRLCQLDLLQVGNLKV